MKQSTNFLSIRSYAQKSIFLFLCVFAAMGNFLLSRCPQTAVLVPPLTRIVWGGIQHGDAVAFLLYFRIREVCSNGYIRLVWVTVVRLCGVSLEGGGGEQRAQLSF
jgi:hypothetical protein